MNNVDEMMTDATTKDVARHEALNKKEQNTMTNVQLSARLQQEILTYINHTSSHNVHSSTEFSRGLKEYLFRTEP